MTRKDYELIARAIRNARSNLDSDEQQKIVDLVASTLADELVTENSRFSRRWFLEAAEYQTLNVE